MANKRIVSSVMWEDEFFTSLSIFERLLWVGLITCAADDQGRLQDNALLIRSRIFPFDDIPITDIDTALHKYCIGGKIVRYIVGNKHAIQIINWWKHQTPQWAGKSLLPAPSGWTDRERYHGKNDPVTKSQTIIEANWKTAGGYLDGYIANYIEDNIPPVNSPKHSNDINSDVNGDIKGDRDGGLPAPYSSILEKITGLPYTPSAFEAVHEFEEMKPLPEDIQAGMVWLSEQKKQLKYYGQLVGPTRTAMSKRIGKGWENGHKPAVDFKGYTEVTK